MRFFFTNALLETHYYCNKWAWHNMRAAAQLILVVQLQCASLEPAMALFKYFGRSHALPTPEQAGLSEKATKAANSQADMCKNM